MRFRYDATWQVAAPMRRFRRPLTPVSARRFHHCVHPSCPAAAERRFDDELSSAFADHTPGYPADPRLGIPRTPPLHDRRRSRVRLSLAVPHRPGHLAVPGRAAVHRLRDRGRPRRLALRSAVRPVGPAPRHVDRPGRLGRLPAALPPRRHPPHQLSADDARLRAARPGVSAVRLRVPRLGRRGDTARPARYGDGVVLVRLHGRPAHARLAGRRRAHPADRFLRHAVGRAGPGGRGRADRPAAGP